MNLVATANSMNDSHFLSYYSIIYYFGFFQNFFYHLTAVAVLGILIILLLYAFRCKGNYLGVLKVLLFTQALYVFFLLIFNITTDIIKGVFLLFDLDIFPFLDYLSLINVLFLIIALSWIIYTVIVGVMIFIDIPYKKMMIPVGISLVIFLYIYRIFISFFNEIFLLLITQPMLDLLLLT
jgi:hypothetical protein